MRLLIFSIFLIAYTTAWSYHKIIPGSIIPGTQNFNLNLFHSIFDLISNILSHNYLAPQWILKNTIQHQSVVTTKPLLKSYDFVIVGAGSAGCVVANRLSADSRVSVLVVEAGGPENIETDAPQLSYTQLRATPIDWAYVSEPLNNAGFNMDEQRVWIPRGRSIGGTSAINAMLYNRGTPADYDNWAKLGNVGWSYTEVFQYFLRSERNLDLKMLANGFHSSKGELIVSSNAALSTHPMSNITIAAFKELGQPLIDFNGPSAIGTNAGQQHILNGQRISVSQAFIEPIINLRKNLQIIDNSVVTKVLFSKENRAIGIEIDRNGEIITVLANKEVILSAGSIASPQILLLSGIGPKDQLKHFDIPVVTDLKGVGENLHDHPYVIGQSFTLPSVGPQPNTFEAFNDYIAKQLGPIGFLDQVWSNYNSSINTDKNWPDVHVSAISTSYNTNPNQAFVEYGMTLNAWNKMYSQYVGRPAFVLRAGVSRPRSRGWLRLASKDIHDHPIININFLSNIEDVIIAMNGLKWHYRAAQTTTFKKVRAEMFDTLVAGCEHLYKLTKDKLLPHMYMPSDEYLECQARSMVVSGFHPVGTCKMGSNKDKLAVVDPTLKVYGVSGLRVIDSSIIPVIPIGNTQAPTMMIAERGAQFIRDTYRLTDGYKLY